MSSRIKSDLLLVDGALRSCPSRALLKGGSIDKWAACCSSLQAVLPILHESVLADQNGTAAAVSMHWRKSSASKKLLALLRAVVEEDHALKDEAAHAASASIIRRCSVHGSISTISFFWQRTQQTATLWPAMREWIVELGGVTSLWTALAWTVMNPTQGFEADPSHQILLRESVQSVLTLTLDMFRLQWPVELTQSPAVRTVMSSVLGDLLPRDFAAGNAQAWGLHIVFHAIHAVCQVSPRQLCSVLSAHLHRPLLAFWPYLIAEMRRQRRLRPEPTGASTPPADVLLELKVRIHKTGLVHAG